MTHPGRKVIDELVAGLGGVTGNKWSVAGAHPDAILSIAEYVRTLEEENSNLRKALEPFDNDWADENGWTDNACQNDRIRDWIGPSDFFAVRAALQPKSTEESK